MNTTSDKLQYLAETKTAIKDAIVAKGVAVADTDTFRSYAGKIGEIQSGGNEFSEIGYESTPQYILDGIEHAKKIQAEWDNPTNCASKFENDIDLKYFPNVQTSQITDAQNIFKNSNLEYFEKLDLSNVENMFSTFWGTRIHSVTNLMTSDKLINLRATFSRSPVRFVDKLISHNVTSFRETFNGCSSLRMVKELDFSSVVDSALVFHQIHRMSFALIKNLGKSKCLNYDFALCYGWGNDANTWDDGSPVVGSRQSLIDSLITYSFDRASAGMPTATITLHANVKARLTEEEKAQITAKGFTIA